MPYYARARYGNRTSNYRKRRAGYRKHYNYHKRKPYFQKTMNGGGQIYHFKRWANGNTFIKNINTWEIDPAGEYKMLFVYPTFKLSDLPNFTEFTRLFSQYRINAVQVRVMFGWVGSEQNVTENPIPIGPGPNRPAVPINAFRPSTDWRAASFTDRAQTRDWDDASSATVTLNAAKEFDTFRWHSSTKCIKKLTYPQAVTPTDQGVVDPPITQLPSAMSNARWYRTAQPNQEFKSFVIGVQPCVPIGQSLTQYWTMSYRLEYKFYISFKSVV